MKALNIAATGMHAQQMNVDVLSNNIANAQTTGFKAGSAQFADLMYQSLKREGAQAGQGGGVRPVGIDIGLGVEGLGVVRNHQQGSLVKQDGAFNLAIDGKGFFVVNEPDGGIAFTRDGGFQLNPEGEIVTLQGYTVDPGIAVPDDAQNIEITEAGVVMAYVPGEAEPVELGELTLATFVNEAGLKTVGGNLYRETAASGAAMMGTPGEDGIGTIKQGWLESANVNVVEQITQLINAQRSYEMNAKTVRTVDEMMSTATQIK